jgi:hypothetical protein
MGHGGIRPNAGRKPKPPTPPPPTKDDARELLAAIGDNEQWRKLAKCKDQRLRFDVLKYLTDRAYGKPVQMIAGADDGKPIGIDVHVHRVKD